MFGNDNIKNETNKMKRFDFFENEKNSNKVKREHRHASKTPEACIRIIAGRRYAKLDAAARAPYLEMAKQHIGSGRVQCDVTGRFKGYYII